MTSKEQPLQKRLLIVAHAPSPNTRRLRDAVVAGAEQIGGFEIFAQGPFDTTPEHVIGASVVILGTPENLGYMSGALKDFFDRCYYPCLEKTESLPYALYVRAGQGGGDGTRRAIESIATGLRWRPVAEPLILRGEWREAFVEKCHELGALMAAGVDMGIF